MAQPEEDFGRDGDRTDRNRPHVQPRRLPFPRLTQSEEDFDRDTLDRDVLPHRYRDLLKGGPEANLPGRHVASPSNSPFHTDLSPEELGPEQEAEIMHLARNVIDERPELGDMIQPGTSTRMNRADSDTDMEGLYEGESTMEMPPTARRATGVAPNRVPPITEEKMLPNEPQEVDEIGESTMQMLPTARRVTGFAPNGMPSITEDKMFSSEPQEVDDIGEQRMEMLPTARRVTGFAPNRLPFRTGDKMFPSEPQEVKDIGDFSMGVMPTERRGTGVVANRLSAAPEEKIFANRTEEGSDISRTEAAAEMLRAMGRSPQEAITPMTGRSPQEALTPMTFDSDGFQDAANKEASQAQAVVGRVAAKRMPQTMTAAKRQDAAELAANVAVAKGDSARKKVEKAKKSKAKKIKKAKSKVKREKELPVYRQPNIMIMSVVLAVVALLVCSVCCCVCRNRRSREKELEAGAAAAAAQPQDDEKTKEEQKEAEDLKDKDAKDDKEDETPAPPPRVVEIAFRSADYIQNVCLKLDNGSEIWHGNPGKAEDQPSFEIKEGDSIKSVTQFGHKVGRLGKGIQFKTWLGEEFMVKGQKISRNDPQPFKADKGMMIVGLKFEGSRLTGIEQDIDENDPDSKKVLEERARKEEAGVKTDAEQEVQAEDKKTPVEDNAVEGKDAEDKETPLEEEDQDESADKDKKKEKSNGKKGDEEGKDKKASKKKEEEEEKPSEELTKEERRKKHLDEEVEKLRQKHGKPKDGKEEQEMEANEAAPIRATFQPPWEDGDIGFEYEEKSGQVTSLKNDAVAELGVKEKLVMAEINGEPYTPELLKEKITAGEEFEITFHQAAEPPPEPKMTEAEAKKAARKEIVEAKMRQMKKDREEQAALSQLQQSTEQVKKLEEDGVKFAEREKEAEKAFKLLSTSARAKANDIIGDIFWANSTWTARLNAAKEAEAQEAEAKAAKNDKKKTSSKDKQDGAEEKKKSKSAGGDEEDGKEGKKDKKKDKEDGKEGKKEKKTKEGKKEGKSKTKGDGPSNDPEEP